MILENKKNLEMSPIESFHNGENYTAYNFFGVHKVKTDKGISFVFRTWAPNAKTVSVVGTFNDWDREKILCNESAMAESGNAILMRV